MQTERPDFIPEKAWQWLPALPFEFSGICGILPLPRVLLEAWCAPPGEEVGDIRLANLSVTPAQVVVGETVHVSCQAENVGTAHAQRTVTLKLNGSASGSQFVSLNPGESLGVYFDIVPHQTGTYQVQVNGLSGSFQATTQPGEAQLSYVSGLYLVDSWEEFQEYGDYYIDHFIWGVKVKNSGTGATTEPFTAFVRAFVNNMTGYTNWGATESKQVTIQPGETVEVTLETQTTRSGSLNYQHMIKSSVPVSVLEPATPLEYICRQCYNLYYIANRVPPSKSELVTFATQAEYEQHMITQHPGET